MNMVNSSWINTHFGGFIPIAFGTFCTSFNMLNLFILDKGRYIDKISNRNITFFCFCLHLKKTASMFWTVRIWLKWVLKLHYTDADKRARVPFTNIVQFHAAWIIDHIPNKVWGEITYPFTNFNSCTGESGEWTSFIPHIIMDAITYPCWD